MTEILRKFEEVMDYGRRSGRTAYVFDPSCLPPPDPGMNWKEDMSLDEANLGQSFRRNIRKEVEQIGYIIFNK